MPKIISIATDQKEPAGINTFKQSINDFGVGKFQTEDSKLLEQKQMSTGMFFSIEKKGKSFKNLVKMAKDNSNPSVSSVVSE